MTPPSSNRRATLAVMAVLVLVPTVTGCSGESASQPSASGTTASPAPTVDKTSIGRLAATQACATTEDASKLRVAIAIDTLAGKTVPQERYQKLAATAVAAEQFAVRAAQNDDRWLTLSRAAAGLAGEPMEPTPGDGYSEVANECTAQGLG